MTTNLFRLLPMALKLLAAGHIDRLIVGDDRDWGEAQTPPEPFTESATIISFGRLMAQAKIPARWPEVSKDDVALLQYTGATTGLPKAAVLTHANLTAAVASYHVWISGQRPPGRRAGPRDHGAAAVPHLRTVQRHAAASGERQ